MNKLLIPVIASVIVLTTVGLSYDVFAEKAENHCVFQLSGFLRCHDAIEEGQHIQTVLGGSGVCHYTLVTWDRNPDLWLFLDGHNVNKNNNCDVNVGGTFSKSSVEVSKP